MMGKPRPPVDPRLLDALLPPVPEGTKIVPDPPEEEPKPESSVTRGAPKASTETSTELPDLTATESD